MDNLNYGIVGNCRSAALISAKGSIEWFCLPQFDAPSVFGSILDKNNGGQMEIIPEFLISSTQSYIDRTNVLCTIFYCKDGIFEVMDFMPRYKTEHGTHYTPPDLVRYFKWIDGAPSFKIRYNPCLEYGKYPTKHSIRDKYIKSQTTKGPYDSLYLYSSINLQDIYESNTITLESDQFTLISYNQKLLEQTVRRSYLKLERTKVYWLNWSERAPFFSKYNYEINRSALVLKLLNYEKSGAVLAALTTSLPETIGEVRNWDYRFCWIRDASMVVKIMSSLGHQNVAKRYMNFIIDLLPDKDELIQIMYGINGEKKLTEFELPHLSGYENSSPVRVGNAAYKQKQNDIYGILMDVIYEQFHMFSTSLETSEELWTIVRNIVKMVNANWKKPDKGIWEIRNDSKHFTFSKVLCWTAIDRAVKIAQILKQHHHAKNWSQLRDTIQIDIETKAWCEEKQAYAQAYGSDDLDASVLLMESYGFTSALDPRFQSTVVAIQKDLEYKDLMFRYKNKDDFGEPKSAFTICSFWLINSLYKIGKKEEAVKKFNNLLSYSNHLGLFSEDLDFETKRLLGNFPQAYSHLALIETAITISEGEKSYEDEIIDAIK